MGRYCAETVAGWAEEERLSSRRYFKFQFVLRLISVQNQVYIFIFRKPTLKIMKIFEGGSLYYLELKKIICRIC